MYGGLNTRNRNIVFCIPFLGRLPHRIFTVCLKLIPVQKIQQRQRSAAAAQIRMTPKSKTGEPNTKLRMLRYTLYSLEIEHSDVCAARSYHRSNTIVETLREGHRSNWRVRTRRPRGDAACDATQKGTQVNTLKGNHANTSLYCKKLIAYMVSFVARVRAHFCCYTRSSLLLECALLLVQSAVP